MSVTANYQDIESQILGLSQYTKQMTLSPKLGVVEISTLWHLRHPLLAQMLIKAASSLRLLEIGMHSPILLFPLPKLQRILWLSSLLWWELGTNFPRSQVLLSDCHFGVSPVNYSGSDPYSDSGEGETTIIFQSVKFRYFKYILKLYTMSGELLSDREGCSGVIQSDPLSMSVIQVGGAFHSLTVRG